MFLHQHQSPKHRVILSFVAHTRHTSKHTRHLLTGNLTIICVYLLYHSLFTSEKATYNECISWKPVSCCYREIVIRFWLCIQQWFPLHWLCKGRLLRSSVTEVNVCTENIVCPRSTAWGRVSACYPTITRTYLWSSFLPASRTSSEQFCKQKLGCTSEPVWSIARLQGTRWRRGTTLDIKRNKEAWYYCRQARAFRAAQMASSRFIVMNSGKCQHDTINYNELWKILVTRKNCFCTTLK